MVCWLLQFGCSGGEKILISKSPDTKLNPLKANESITCLTKVEFKQTIELSLTRRITSKEPMSGA